MKDQFKILIQSRKSFNAYIKALSVEELNMVPPGFKNSIIWNIGHIIASHQSLCYKLSGLPMNVDNDFLDYYSKGSVVNSSVDADGIAKVKALLRSTSDRVIIDYQNGLFKHYQPYDTSYGLKLDSIEIAIAFCNIHESIHLGYIMAMIRSTKTDSK